MFLEPVNSRESPVGSVGCELGSRAFTRPAPASALVAAVTPSSAPTPTPTPISAWPGCSVYLGFSGIGWQKIRPRSPHLETDSGHRLGASHTLSNMAIVAAEEDSAACPMQQLSGEGSRYA